MADRDRSEILMNELNRTIVNIYKVCIEEMGYDMGVTKNFIEYHNYLINTPITLRGKSDDDDRGNNFEQNTIPPGGQVDFGNVSNIDGVVIPDSVKRNQRLGKCPPEFIAEVTKASKITGIPVNFYIAYGALESRWRNCAVNTSGYGGYFGQRPSQGGTGSIFNQAQGIMVSIYKNALKDAKKYGFSGADLAVWCYLCHNAGNAGARTMLNALGGKLRQTDIRMYEAAAQAFVSKYGKKWSASTQAAQVKEKTLSIPKAYYIISQI